MKPAVRPTIILLTFAIYVGLAFASDEPVVWRPISPAELQMKAPVVEPDSDAEAIFWKFGWMIKS
jgi:hypothetical protein